MDVRRKKLRVTFFFLAFIGFLIVTTSFYIYNQIQVHLGTTNSPIHLVVNKIPFVPKQGVIGGINVAILQSGYTAEHLARALKTEEEKQAVRRNFQELSRFWRQQFAARRINADIINDRQLLTDLYRYNVLVLPLVHCMSDEQIEAVKAFVDANKGVLMTHISGNRDEEGTERHWSLTEDITGGRPIFDLRLREGSTFHQMHSIGLTPITANLAPGAPISIASFDAPLRLRLREGRVFPAAVWLPVDEMHTGRVREDTAIAFGEYLGGRFVWMGFTVNGVGPQRKNWERVDRIIDNAIQWVSHRAVMSTMPWPEGRPVATFAIKAERDIARGASVQRVFAEKGIRPALLLSPDNLSINQMLLQSMRDSVEFGLHLDITKERQKEGFDTAFEQRLQRGRNEFRSILEIDVTSFNLAVRPEPGINHTLDKFLRMGYEFLWIDENDSYAPEIPPIYNQPLFRRLRTPVLFFQSGNPAKLYPDFNPNQEWSTAQRRDLLSTWIRDFEFTRSLNALHTGILPASAVGTDATLPILSEFLQHVRGSGAWLASPSEIAEQWRHHESLRARLIESARMLTIIVSNDSNVALPPFRLRIFPGRMPSSVSVRAERIYVSIPEHVINTSEGYIDLIFSDLGRRENRIYYVELNLPRGSVMGSLLNRVYLVLCASLVFVMTGCAAQQQLSGHRSYPFVVVGYFAEWGIYTADYTLADVPADRLTHLIYSFAKIEDGRIAIVDPQAALHFEMPADRPESWPAGQLAQLRTLRERNPHLKVMVALGGWTLSANFSDAVLDDSSRKRLAASIVTFLREHSLDGVDLDWEYPVAGGLPDNVNRPEDKENYVKFVRILRSLLNEYRTTRGERYLITVATPAPDNYLRNFDLRAMAAYVDWFNIMAYDYEGAWSPQTGHLAPLLSRDGRPSVASTVQAHLKQGVGKHQLVLGVPLYARAWNGVSAVDHGLFQPARGPFEGGEEPGFINYGTLMRRHLSDPEAYRVHSDSKSGADFIFNEALQGGSWFSFETPRTFRNKLSWARGKPLRGIMFWSLEGDLRTPGHSLSLLQQLPVQSRALQPETDD